MNKNFIFNINKNDKLFSKSLNDAKNIIDQKGVVIYKSAISKELVLSIKNYLMNIGRNTLPNYNKMDLNCQNFHRLNQNDERSFVKGCFQQFNFFPWNQDYFNLFKYMKNIFQIKNVLSGLDKDYLLNTTNEYGSYLAPKVSFQFYPAGGGYLNKHVDPVDKHQTVIATLVMSTFGDDFTNGGSYTFINNRKVFIERSCGIGDVYFSTANVPHGVDPIDSDKKLNWLNYSGRWMGLFSINKFSLSSNITDSKEVA